ncbi:MAG: glycosyltransferase family 2 protein [Rubrobacteraceae bacterium]
MSPEKRETGSPGDADALPPVSVIMAVYNGEPYIGQALESVLRQTHQDFEFIIVDDGSTDRTGKVLDDYAARDARIRVISQTNADQPASLNRALAEAEHEWVAVLDADDACMPHRLETQLRALLREPSIRVIGSRAVWMNQWGKERGVRAFGPESVSEFERLVERDENVVIVHPSAMMHRQTVLSLGGYDTNFGPAADIELWSRVSDEYAVVSLPEPLIYYRVHPENMSITRFFEQKLMTRWIKSRQRARRRGLPQPTFKEYRDSHEVRLTLRRLNHARQDWGQYLMLRSVLAWWAGRRPIALMMRAAAIALVPVQATSRSRVRPGRPQPPGETV